MTSLHFKGRVFVENFHLGVPYHELTPVRGKGLAKKASLHDNLIVEGDNLAALKALLPTYHGKVKCVYIDPPYNTGNEGWAYNDRVNSPMMQDWLGKVVDREDVTRHDKWSKAGKPRRIYADFIMTLDANEPNTDDEFHQVFVMEMKGVHLKDSADTNYKRSVFDLCSEHAKKRPNAGAYRLRLLASPAIIPWNKPLLAKVRSGLFHGRPTGRTSCQPCATRWCASRWWTKTSGSNG